MHPGLHRAPLDATGALTVLLLLGSFAPPGLRAQRAERNLFPDESYFTVPVAGSREPQFGFAVLVTDVLDDQDPPEERPPFEHERRGDEVQAAGALGATLRVWRPLRWSDGGVIVGIQGGAFARFRMELSGNDLLASDWLVAVPVEARLGDLSGRLRVFHWSSHLGDEFAAATSARRVDFTYEAVELVGAYRAGPARLYGGGAVTFATELEDPDLPTGVSDAGQLQAGIDVGWSPWFGGTAGIRGGLDLVWADRVAWDPRMTAVLALEARARERALRLEAVYFDGPSTMGQFFLSDERYWGLQIRIDL